MSVRPRRWPTAVYREVLNFSERDNAYLEALPPVPSRAELQEALTRLLPIDRFRAMRTAPAEVRMGALLMVRHVYQPGSRDLALAKDVIDVLRAGYVNRNPAGANFMTTLKRGLAALHDPGFDPDPDVLASGIAVLGVSGMGKTTSVGIVLDCLPRVIHHTGGGQYGINTHQIVWLKISCPRNGSVKQLCRDFIAAVDRLLGETYARKHGMGRADAGALQMALTAVANAHGLGILVIDEIQNLRRASVEDRAITLTFLVSLMNGLGVPVVLVGTKDSRHIVEGAVPTARRTAGGLHEYERYMLDANFCLLIETLWEYQLVDNLVELDVRDPDDPARLAGQPPEWTQLFYHYSQGIPDIAVKLFIETQRAAISGARRKARSTITPELVHHVWNSRFKLMHVHIKRIRDGEEPHEPAYSEAVLKLNAKFDGASPSIPKPFNEMPDGVEQPCTPDGKLDEGGRPAGHRKSRISRAAHAHAMGQAASPEILAQAHAQPQQSTLARMVAEGAREGLAPHEAVRSRADGDGE